MRLGTCVASVIGLAIGSCGWADVPTPDQVITKCLASYDAAKTYQGTVVIRIDRGDQKTRTTLELKAENGNNGMIARSAIHLTTSTSGPSSATSTEMLIIDDGTSIFTVDTKKKEYWEQPHGGDRISGMFRQMTENARSSVSKLKVTLERFHDRPVYRVAGSGVSGAVSIAVDRETYLIYTAGGSSGVGAARSRSELTATNQAFNKPIGAAAFTWSPPAGFVKQREKVGGSHGN
jgi:outer membrane lipoprotein-sorting protein